MSTSIEEHARRVADWPPLTPEVVREIRELLPSVSDDLARHIRWVAETATAPDAETLARVRALLPPVPLRDEGVAEQMVAEDAAHRRAVDRSKKRRRDPADIALEVLAERLDRMRAQRKERDRVSAAGALARDAARIAEKLDIPFSEAYGQAKAMAEARRMDEERRRTHADGHLWCVPDECEIAARREVP